MKYESMPKSGVESGEITNTESNNANPNRHLDLLGIVSKGDTKILNGILGNIMTVSTDPFQRILAEEMLRNFDKAGDVKFDSTFNEEGVAGRFSPDNTVKVNLSNPKNSNLSGLSETILHETQHSFVNKAIKQFVENPGKLSPEVREAVADLNRLRTMYQSRVIAEYTKEKYDTIVEALKGVKIDSIAYNKIAKEYGEEALYEVYASNNLMEFSTLSMTNDFIQRQLNEHDDPSARNESMFQKFLHIINKLFAALGFNVNKNSILAGAIRNNIVIMTSREPSISPDQSFKDLISDYTPEDTDMPGVEGRIPTPNEVYK
ncbi:MAG TPA: hypothetical protein PLG47_06530, partial [Candidatus Dojkabacteria bacterium]|nr:hypothetical protein [Candidatus Dojkabacteria bacterium]